MNGRAEWNMTTKHPKTIIHIDIDCFYAQVELLKQPHLQNEPVGVKQKNLLVTCNYVARSHGVKKCMAVSEALSICPNLVLFNGEDLHKYRLASNEIHLFLLSFTSKVEKSGFDENYLDVSDLVSDKERKMKEPGFLGHCIGDLNNSCLCGCHKRLFIGSLIAYEIRKKLESTLGMTSCCGISYNKLLAKLSCSAHKPNQQTILFPNGTLEFLLSLNNVEKLPGIGVKTKQVLESAGVKTVKDLQQVDIEILKEVFKSEDMANNLKNLSFGIFDAQVKPSGKPNSIGLEDGFRVISVESEVKEKFRKLLQRLMILVEEDGRIPMSIKVTIRKSANDKKMGNKETKQSPIPSYLFNRPVGKLSEDSTNKLLNIIMGLFSKMVSIAKPFHVTLLGLAFSKFHEKASNRSIASFLLKKRDLSVQYLTSFASDETSLEPSDDQIPSCSKPESDSETEPSPKKAKLDFLEKKKNSRREEGNGSADACSPSKLRVECLNLNGDWEIPKEVDPEVFKELPLDIQEEIVRGWKNTNFKIKSLRKQSLIENYYISKTKTKT